MYFPTCMFQNFLNAGLNLAYANVLYMNLPEENSTTHIAFSSVGCNLFAFFGLLLGTKVSAIGGDTPNMLLGMPVYTVQYTLLMRAGFLLILGLILTLDWKRFTRDEDIQAIEARK